MCASLRFEMNGLVVVNRLYTLANHLVIVTRGFEEYLNHCWNAKNALVDWSL